MDIAEIRKKAKTGRGHSPVLDQPVESVPPVASPPVIPPQPVSAAPAAIIVGGAEAAPAAMPELPSCVVEGVAETSAIDALFNWNGDLQLGSEEGYRQGLQLRAEENKEDVCQWLAFSLGSEEYALDITSIREIIKPREITEIPRAPDFLLGIISLRGTIIPVFDLRNRLKLGRGEVGPGARIVVCQHEERTAGLLVDCISQVVNLPRRMIEPPPAVLSGLDRELVAGVGRHQGKMMILLQLSNVLNAELY